MSKDEREKHEMKSKVVKVREEEQSGRARRRRAKWWKKSKVAEVRKEEQSGRARRREQKSRTHQGKVPPATEVCAAKVAIPETNTHHWQENPQNQQAKATKERYPGGYVWLTSVDRSPLAKVAIPEASTHHWPRQKRGGKDKRRWYPEGTGSLSRPKPSCQGRHP